MIIIFSGSSGRLPYGGHAWIDMQYLAGLRDLGHDVFYLEECGSESWVYNWEEGHLTNEMAYPSAYVRACLELLGLGQRWIYRAGERSEGMSTEEFWDVCSMADLMVIRAVPLATWRPEYELPRKQVFIDADPGFTQISLVKGHPELQATVERCSRLFTIGQRIGQPECPIPTAGKEWVKTLPPISLAYWPWVEDGSATHFTSVMHWRGFRDVDYEGVLYGQKDKEYPKFLDLPKLTTQPLRIALTGGDAVEMSRHGWQVVEGWRQSQTPESYRAFIQESRAEFGVAKHGYVLTQGGWFSDRSVCYLACGRPVLVEDTGLGEWLPVGAGIVTFHDVSSAIGGIESINADYESHRRAARLLAEDYFATERVLPRFLEAAMA